MRSSLLSLVLAATLAASMGAWMNLYGAASQAQTGSVAAGGADLLSRARALHRQSPLVDGHNDFPWALRQMNVGLDLDRADISRPQSRLHTDIPRLRAGGVGMQFWSVYVAATDPNPVQTVFQQIDVVHRMMRKWPETFEIARTAANAERIFRRGRIASMIGMEGGHSIGGSLDTLRRAYSQGARYMTLTHSVNVGWADSGTDTPKLGGLSAFGEEVVREMNRLGMLVDLSHTSPETMEDAIRVSAAPVVFSHSSARALNDHRRNVPDSILRLLPANGGVVMVTFVPAHISSAVREHGVRTDAERARLRALYPGDDAQVNTELEQWRRVNPVPRATLSQVADHIDHIRMVAGIDHIGLGGDFDGITSVTQGLEDVSTYPALTAELLRRGYRDADLAKILGQNILRAWRAAEQVAEP